MLTEDRSGSGSSSAEVIYIGSEAYNSRISQLHGRRCGFDFLTNSITLAQNSKMQSPFTDAGILCDACQDMVNGEAPRGRRGARGLLTAVKQNCKVCKLVYLKHGKEKIFEGNSSPSFWIWRRGTSSEVAELYILSTSRVIAGGPLLKCLLLPTLCETGEGKLQKPTRSPDGIEAGE